MFVRLALTFLIGGLGGALFFWLKMPLAWMLGAMCSTTIAALARAPLQIHFPLRNFMATVVGVMLGASFTPDNFSRLSTWLNSIVLLAAFSLVSGAVCYQFLRKAGGMDRSTAFFGGAPGGLNEMILYAESYGGNVATVSLLHAIRLLIVIFTIPVYFRVVEQLDVPSMASGIHILNFAAKDALILLACGLVGWQVGKRLKLPAAQLLGPMIFSAAAHLAGITSSNPPPEVVAVAQVVLGSAVGARFSSVPLKEVGRVGGLAVAAAAISVGIAVAFATAFDQLVHVSRAGLMLALAPGGLAEMSLVALALGVDTAYVATMHVMRIAMIVIFARPIFAMFRRMSGKT